MSENPTVKHVRPFQMTFGEPYYHFQYGNRGKFQRQIARSFNEINFLKTRSPTRKKFGDKLTFSWIKISLHLKPNFSAAKNHSLSNYGIKRSIGSSQRLKNCRKTNQKQFFSTSRFSLLIPMRQIQLGVLFLLNTGINL